ncbi:pentapeptide repeat-containing protein [Azospirillum sp.]|uniref:pentapeptide repeat-containing protein n=1 Tax=Azospirillum sp. TaxID=34012 RepID=UPI002D3B51C8|nr:pentapeptide repeat-containing protein [Azospirillum sp.]HYD69198.1 pentapeptide repeat-containing protein [Azospirillum sp.]
MPKEEIACRRRSPGFRRALAATVLTLLAAPSVAQPLPGCDLSPGYPACADAHLRGSDLRGFDLRNADLTRADLSGADLSGANLGGANLAGTDFRDANLTGADLRGTHTFKAKWKGADLSGAIWKDGHRCQPGSIGACR